MALPPPTVSQLVHYVSKMDLKCQAALITDVASGVSWDADEHVSLTIFGKDGLSWVWHSPHDEIDKQAGTWHWPE